MTISRKHELGIIYFPCSLIIQKCNDSPDARFPIMYLRITKRKGHKSTCNFTKIAKPLPSTINFPLFFSYLNVYKLRSYTWNYSNENRNEIFVFALSEIIKHAFPYVMMQSPSMLNVEINFQFLHICSINRISRSTRI